MSSEKNSDTDTDTDTDTDADAQAQTDTSIDADDSDFLSGSSVAETGFGAEQTVPDSEESSVETTASDPVGDADTDEHVDAHARDRQPRSDGLESPRSPPVDDPLSDTLTYADSPAFDIGSLPSHMQSAVLPGQFDLPYVYARTDKEISKWERPKNVRVNVFPEVSDQLAETEEYLNDEVFPETDVKTCDLYMAALIAGMINVDDIETVLKNWGYDTL